MASSATVPGIVYLNGAIAAQGAGWTYSSGLVTITGATSSAAILSSQMSQLSIQAKDAASTNLPRAVTVKLTFINGSTSSFTSNSAGLCTISNVPHGANSFTVFWGDIQVSSSTAITISGITSTSQVTRIQRLTDGSYYALFALNNTALVAVSYLSILDLKWPGQTGTGTPYFKADVLYWKQAGQPVYFKYGSYSIDHSAASWSWSSNVLECPVTFVSSSMDLSLSWQAAPVDQGGVITPSVTPTPTPPPGTIIDIPGSPTNDTYGVLPPGVVLARPSVDTTVIAVIIIGVLAVAAISVRYITAHASNAVLWNKKSNPRAKDKDLSKKFEKRKKAKR
jgi:hypothetical protein